MINIIHKSDCCGCAACVQICPKQCIQFNEDSQGFYYPNVNLLECVNCGLCEKVCPIINQNDSRPSDKVYAAKNICDDVRKNSSSGGVFTLMAEYILKDGGVVFGAVFDEKLGVKHTYTESIDKLTPFQGSKYVQSVIGYSYIKAKQFLEEGRKVLFTGTPCQIAGLKKFLRKEYSNLLSVDVVCHGVPSPLIWRSYLEYIRNKKQVYDITNVSFRSKSTGWRQYSVSIYGRTSSSDKQERLFVQESVDKNIYMQFFLNDLSIRPSCFQCPSKCGKSYSDITLGDFWGIENIHPIIDDDKGVSLVMLNTVRGVDVFNKLDVLKLESTYEQAIKYNPSIEHSAVENIYTKIFWSKFISGGVDASKVVLNHFKISLIHRVIRRIKKIINGINE